MRRWITRDGKIELEDGPPGERRLRINGVGGPITDAEFESYKANLVLTATNVPGTDVLRALAAGGLSTTEVAADEKLVLAYRLGYRDGVESLTM